MTFYHSSFSIFCLPLAQSLSCVFLPSYKLNALWGLNSLDDPHYMPQKFLTVSRWFFLNCSKLPSFYTPENPHYFSKLKYTRRVLDSPSNLSSVLFSAFVCRNALFFKCLLYPWRDCFAFLDIYESKHYVGIQHSFFLFVTKFSYLLIRCLFSGRRYFYYFPAQIIKCLHLFDFDSQIFSWYITLSFYIFLLIVIITFIKTNSTILNSIDFNCLPIL